MPNEYDNIRTRVLTDNTAQGVLNHLRALESNRTHVLTRWVWELLQNARDASANSDTDLVASIEHTQETIFFQHNGANFKVDEIAHLIYHGSTKIESTESIGQYGSGFLTTHLLSPDIDVSGQLDDGMYFEFQLKREVGSVGELSQSMDQAWSDFQSSLLDSSVENDFTTRFQYPLRAASAEAVDAGLAMLKRCAPFVVVFNQEFSRIDFKSPDETMNFTVVKRTPLEQEGLQQITVEESKNGSRTEKKYLLVQGEQASVAVALGSIGDDLACLPVGDTPRLFLGFPLIGTENFSFPAVINSLSFTPTENRDGVYLGQSGNDVANINNQTVIEEACELLVRLLRFVASSGWRDAYFLATVPDIHERDWLNPDWLRNCLEKLLIENVRQTPTVLNEASEEIPPDNIELAIAETADAVETLWDLLDAWQGDREILPRRNEAVGWCNAVKSWAGILGCEVTSFDEAIDGRKLASWVETETKRDNKEFARLENLQHLLREDVCAVEWLDQLYAFLTGHGLDDVIRTHSIVLNQDGYLDRLSNLHRDQDVTKELKDIAELLDWDIRQELRDTRFISLGDEPGAGNRDNEYVIGELIKRLQECIEKNPDSDFEKASVRLFARIVAQEKWDLLRGFPVFSAGDSDSRRIIKLQRAEEDDERPLAPVRAWPENLQLFSDLFPPHHTLSDDFFEATSDSVWQTLSEKCFLWIDVVITKNKYHNDFLPDASLNEDEEQEQEHRTDECVRVTSLAFLTKDEVGIMARVRQSQSRARLFWRFLTEWLIVRDLEGLKINEALCVCEENRNHCYYPAEWLVPLVRNKWVPIRSGLRVRVTARSLASLLRDSEWNPNSLSEDPEIAKLLEAIGVTHLDLLREFSASDDEQRKSQDKILAGILAATDGNLCHLNHVHEYIEDLKSDDALPGILEDRRKQRQIVHKNQCLGEQVENLVRQNLEDEGFTVERVPIGSDFEIEHDLVEKDEEVGFEASRNGRKWLVEVKATRGQDVRMTATQAKTATKRKDRFLLCVVPIEDENTRLDLDKVRATMRFVANIGSRVDKLCNDFYDLEELRDDITADECEGVQLEIISGAARVRIASSVWRTGACLNGLLQLLGGQD